MPSSRILSFDLISIFLSDWVFQRMLVPVLYPVAGFPTKLRAEVDEPLLVIRGRADVDARIYPASFLENSATVGAITMVSFVFCLQRSFAALSARYIRQGVYLFGIRVFHLWVIFVH